jgi:hypothetical protein
MSWLKQLRGKRPKSNNSSPHEACASTSQASPTPTASLDLKGKKPARDTIAAESQGVGGFYYVSHIGMII